MGLLDLLSADKRKEAALKRRIKKATDKWRQGEDRQKALFELREDGSPGAIEGLLRRFQVNVDKTIEDEQEKDWVFEWLVELGSERVLPALRKALKNAPTISWPLRLADKMLDRDALWELVRETLDTMDPEYTRDPTRKQQVIAFLGELRDRRVPDALLPYLGDHDEAVRFLTIEALLRHRNEVAREPLLRLLVDEREESLRIRNRICEGLAETRWTVTGHRGQVEKLLPDAFTLDREGHVRRKKSE